MTHVNRRTVLTTISAAAIAAPAASVKAVEADPILPLLAEHDRLEKIWMSLQDEVNRIHSALPDRIKFHPCRGGATAEEVAEAERACGYTATMAEADKAWDDYAAVATAACKTVPTTPEGLLAQVDYLKDLFANGSFGDSRELDCIASIRQAVVRGLV